LFATGSPEAATVVHRGRRGALGLLPPGRARDGVRHDRQRRAQRQARARRRSPTRGPSWRRSPRPPTTSSPGPA